MPDNKIQKPFLKWVGGKTQIIDHVIDRFPQEIENYHEVFLGGGSVLFALLSLQKEGKIKIIGKIYAYDLNKRLINLYRHLQTNKDELFRYITYYLEEYDSITELKVKDKKKERKPTNLEMAKTSKESYYYWMRHLFKGESFQYPRNAYIPKDNLENIDEDSIESSALFLVINKTCFRGMYREGPNGFNIPFGNYKKTPKVITKSDLDTISELIQKVEFRHCDFSQALENVKERDFVYLDPPYVPESAISFVGYTADGFELKRHHELFDKILEFREKKIKFVLSNAKVDLVMNHLKDLPYQEIEARRSINAKKPGSKTTEVIIYN